MVEKMKTFTLKTPKGRTCTIGVRREYDYDELFAKHLKPFGHKWTIIHSPYGYKVRWNEKVEWMTQLDERTPEDVLDYLYDTYGTGRVWGFVEEIAVRA